MSTQLVPNLRPSAFPFQVAVTTTFEQGKLQYQAAVHYHSRLYRPFELEKKYFKYDRVNITGLDKIEKFDESRIQKGVHCVLELDINILDVKSAKIVWVDSNDDKKLVPIEIDNDKDRVQLKARVIIGSLLFDQYAMPGVSSELNSKEIYFYQHINTHLIVANMLFAGTPVVYPVPFPGYIGDKK
jgi:hypothetical protein